MNADTKTITFFAFVVGCCATFAPAQREVFEARCMTDEQFKSLARPITQMIKSIGDASSPPLRQRMTDVYIVVVRKPDRPYLRKSAAQTGHPLYELIPGENHRETRGYRFYRDSVAITDEVVKQGTTLSLTQPGRYQAAAVEWSGLESEKSHAISVAKVEVPVNLTVCSDKPDDFSWISRRWNADHSQCETAHLYDGVIRREWYDSGVITKRHDFNEQGRAIRRMEFRDGKMAVRQYYRPNDSCMSREVFDDAGFITEFMRYGAEIDHWWYDRGYPARHVRGRREYVKQGNRWGYFQNGKFIDTPRER